MTVRQILTMIATFARRAIGLVFLLVGILGVLLPILPGWPFLIPAIVLLGRRDPLLRWLNLHVRLAVRWLRNHRHPLVGGAGARISKEYMQTCRMIAPMLDRMERFIAPLFGSAPRRDPSV